MEKKEKWEKEHNIKIAIVEQGRKTTLAQLAMEMYGIQKPKQEEKDIEK